MAVFVFQRRLERGSQPVRAALGGRSDLPPCQGSGRLIADLGVDRGGPIVPGASVAVAVDLGPNGDTYTQFTFTVPAIAFPASGVVEVELSGTSSYEGHTWSFTISPNL